MQGLWKSLMRSGRRFATVGALVGVALGAAAIDARAEELGLAEGGRLSLTACRSAEQALREAKERILVQDPTCADLLRAAHADVLDALSAADGTDWPGNMLRKERTVGRKLRVAARQLARTEDPNVAARFPIVLRLATGALRQVSRTTQILEGAVTTFARSASSDTVTNPDGSTTSTSASAFAWTNLSPSADSKIVYVSSSSGADSNDGASRETPVKSLKHAQSLVRAGYPDWILLRRGDTWTGEWFEATAGRTKGEPSVVWSYGDGTSRPKLVNGGYYAPGARSNLDHIAVIGLEIERTDPAFDWCGIAIESGSADVLIEDCLVSGFRVNVLAASIDHSLADVRVRGCVIVDAHPDPNAPHSSGFLAHAVDGLTLEGCVFDHNGWDYTSTAASTQNHNVYLMPDTCWNVVVRNNVFSRGSSHGIAQGCGGVNEDNLYLQNGIGMWYRGAGAIRRNVILDGRDCGPDDARGWGIDVSDANGLEVAGNVVAHQRSGSYSIGIKFDRTMTDTSVHGNVVYDWDGPWGGYALMNNATAIGGNRIFGNTFVQPKRFLVYCEADVDPTKLEYADNTYNCGDDASKWFEAFFYQCGIDMWVEKSHEVGAKTDTATFPDADRDVGTYMTTLGGTATLEAFLAEARSQSRSNWRPQFAAEAVTRYVREGMGFALPASTEPAPTDTSTAPTDPTATDTTVTDPTATDTATTDPTATDTTTTDPTSSGRAVRRRTRRR